MGVVHWEILHVAACINITSQLCWQSFFKEFCDTEVRADAVYSDFRIKNYYKIKGKHMKIGEKLRSITFPRKSTNWKLKDSLALI